MLDASKLTEALEVNDWGTMAQDAKSAAYFVKTKGNLFVYGLCVLAALGAIFSPGTAVSIVTILLPTAFLIWVTLLFYGNVLSFIGMYASSRSQAAANAALNKKP